VSGPDLLSIGSFAMASGLSISALRHYDEVGLLKPALVDPATGYRRYRPAQLSQARLICALRRVDLPIAELREVLADPADGALTAVLSRHRDRLARQAGVLSQLVRTVDGYIENGVAMPEITSPRIVQATINVSDLAQAAAFYQAAFGATFNEEISSLTFGTWPGDDFFLLTIAHPANQHGEHAGPAGSSRFGLLVRDLDVAHGRALEAGGTQIEPPYRAPWKPRCSCVADPSGNWIDLYQG